MKDADGSTYFTFEYELNQEMARKGYFTVDKGSVTVNGVSLTVCDPTDNTFTVAIIPYTRENTNFCDIEVGTVVNIEFDILANISLDSRALNKPAKLSTDVLKKLAHFLRFAHKARLNGHFFNKIFA